MKRILVIDDDHNAGTFINMAPRQAGFDVTFVNAYAAAAEAMTRPWDAIVSDLHLDDLHTGLELLRLPHDAPFILLTGAADIESSVAALQAGAFDYLAKPVSQTRLLVTVRKALERPTGARGRARTTAPDPHLVGRTEGIVELYKGVARAAASDSPALIVGDEGSGKLLVAREIHMRGPRASAPFVVTYASSISADTNILSGCEGGTLVIAHADELSPALQLRLAHLLTACGGQGMCEVRLIATVRSDSRLRPELAYPLSVLKMRVPTLAERSEDLPLIVDEVLKQVEPRVRKQLSLGEDVIEKLRGRRWTANVRELIAVLEAAALGSRDGRIEGDDLPTTGPMTTPPATTVEVESADPGAPRFAGNRYLPLRLLARSEMSTVWLAWQPSLSRRVVIKTIACTGAEDAERFQREARIHASLRHPRIPAVCEAGVDETVAGRRYLVMEHVEGTSLELFNRRHPSNREEDRIRSMVEHVADAAGVVHFIHERGLVHRDIKPQNILIGADRKAYVIDYGLARPVAPSEQLTIEGVVQGTIPFMSPEHVTGIATDILPQSDVWSLAATLYSLLTWQMPFGGGDFETYAERLKTADPVPPSGINPHVGEGLDRIILQALRRPIEERTATAKQFEDALRAELASVVVA